MNLKPYTKLETIEIMICETKNELTKTRVMASLARRQTLRLSSDNSAQQTLKMMEAKIGVFERTLEDLETMHKQEVADKAKHGDTASAD